MLVRHMTHPRRGPVAVDESFEDFKDACCDAVDVLRQSGRLYLLPTGAVTDRTEITAASFPEVSASWFADPSRAAASPVWVFDTSEEVAQSGVGGAGLMLGSPSMSKRSPGDDWVPVESATDRTPTTAYSRDPKFPGTVRGRDGNRCCVCEVTEPLEAAHIVGLDSSFDNVAELHLGSADKSFRNMVTYVRLIHGRVVHSILKGPVSTVSTDIPGGFGSTLTLSLFVFPHRNGFMLCVNCHRLFDAGAFIFEEELKMTVRSETLRHIPAWSERHGVFQLDFSRAKGVVYGADVGWGL